MRNAKLVLVKGGRPCFLPKQNGYFSIQLIKFSPNGKKVKQKKQNY